MATKDFLAFLFEEKHVFINNKDPFSEAMLGRIVKMEGTTFHVLWYSLNNSVATKGILEYEIDIFEQQIDPFIVVEGNRTFKEEKYTDLRNGLKKNWHKIINTLHSTPQNRLTVEECLELVAEEIGVSASDASGIIKTQIGLDTLRFVNLKADDYIALSPDSIELENKKRYLSSISNEIKNQSDRINYVISHGQTVGNYREQLFISVLRKYVPKKFHVATGFIEGSTKQIDILIYDQHNYIPVFREDDLVVVKKESVVAVIKIKTTLTSTALIEALQGILLTCQSGMNSVPFFKGIFAFNTEMKNKSVANTIASFYKDYGIDALHHHLDVVCVPNKICSFIDYNNIKNEDYSCPSLFTLEDAKGLSIGESFFFQKLFSFLDVEISARRINNLYFRELRNTANLTLNKVLTDDNWTPFLTFHTEDINATLPDEYDQAIEIIKGNVKKRIKNVKEWMNGDMSREQLIEMYNNDLD